MKVSFNTFVQNLVTTGKFWVFSAGSSEWQYILYEIGTEFFPDAEEALDDFGMIIPTDQPDDALKPVYWARKARLPVEVLEVRLGVGAKVLTRASIIELKPYPAPPVQPTVNYYGRA